MSVQACRIRGYGYMFPYEELDAKILKERNNETR